MSYTITNDCSNPRLWRKWAEAHLREWQAEKKRAEECGATDHIKRADEAIRRYTAALERANRNLKPTPEQRQQQLI